MVHLSLNEEYGTLILRENNRELVLLTDFPVADFREQLQQWVAEVTDEHPKAFVYIDPSGELTGSLRIEPRPAGWQFTSLFEQGRHRECLELQAVLQIVSGA